MSEVLDEIFEKYSDVFIGRAEEIKEFLLKHYKDVLLRRELINCERLDETDRIKKSGFRTNLSSWRNTYQNIVISLGMEIEGEKKRFDYKFYFTEEALSEELVEQVEEDIKAINSFKRNFQFSEALSKIDDVVKVVRENNDRYYDKKLTDLRKEIIEAEKKYNEINEDITKLQKVYQEDRDSDNFDEALSNCQQIIQLAKTNKKKAIIK